MKKVLLLLGFFAFFALTSTTTSSCSRKSGCITAENAQVKTNRKGDLPSKGGSSQLFPKKMRRNR